MKVKDYAMRMMNEKHLRDEAEKMLIVDSDIEAPGLSWIQGEVNDNAFSYLDLLTLIQDEEDIEKIVDIAQENSEIVLSGINKNDFENTKLCNQSFVFIIFLPFGNRWFNQRLQY